MKVARINNCLVIRIILISCLVVSFFSPQSFDRAQAIEAQSLGYSNSAIFNALKLDVANAYIKNKSQGTVYVAVLDDNVDATAEVFNEGTVVKDPTYAKTVFDRENVNKAYTPSSNDANYSHGTQVASVIAGKDGVGVDGEHIKIIPVRYLKYPTAGDYQDRSNFYSNFEKALDHLIDLKTNHKGEEIADNLKVAVVTYTDDLNEVFSDPMYINDYKLDPEVANEEEGYNPDNPLIKGMREKIKQLYNLGVVITSSEKNNNSVNIENNMTWRTIPGIFNGMMAVSGVEKINGIWKDSVATQSGGKDYSGTTINGNTDISAPNKNYKVPLVGSSQAQTSGTVSGNSLGAAVVAGFAAKVASVNSKLTSSDIWSYIQGNVLDETFEKCKVYDSDNDREILQNGSAGIVSGLAIMRAADASTDPDPGPQPDPDPDPDPDPEPATSTVKVQYGGHSAAQGATSITLNGAQVDDGTKVKAGDVLNFTTKHVEWGGNVVLVKSAKINNDQIFSSDNIYKGAWRSSPDSSVIWSNIVNSVDTFSYAIPENSSDEVVIDVQFQELSPIWRLFNPTTKEHVFTSSRAEYDFNVNGGFGVYYNGEGIDWFAPASSDTGIVRLFNAAYARRGLCAHYYCTKREAEEVRQAFPGEWEYDFNGAPVFYSGGDIPVYTAFKASENMSHHYTTNRFEYDTLASWGWDLEPQKSFVNGVATGIFRAAMKGM